MNKGGRPEKMTVSEAIWSTDVFKDDRVFTLIDETGWEGFAVYFYICQRGYRRNGYFYAPQQTGDALESIARAMGSGMTVEVAARATYECFYVNLFDLDIFKYYGLITSKDMQRTFWKAAHRRIQRTISRDIWLLQDELPDIKTVNVPSVHKRLKQTKDGTYYAVPSIAYESAMSTWKSLDLPIESFE